MDPQQQAEQQMMDYALLAVLAKKPLLDDGQAYWPDLDERGQQLLALASWDKSQSVWGLAA